MRVRLIAPAILLRLASFGMARADCTSPAAPAGYSQYFTASNTWKFCNGTSCTDFIRETADASASLTWSPNAAVEQNDWTSVTYDNGLFVAVAYIGVAEVMTSPDLCSKAGVILTTGYPVGCKPTFKGNCSMIVCGYYACDSRLSGQQVRVN